MEKKDSKITERKVVIAGLDNSGKTSIILSLQGYRNLNKYQSVSGTLGRDIKKFKGENKNFIVWELGGQEKYRDEYSNNMHQYAGSLDKFIFVIDVQDTERYTVALLYLLKFIEYFDENKITPEISIFLHKFDSDLESNPDFSDEKIQEKLIKKIKDGIPGHFPMSILKTSIFTVFEQKKIFEQKK